MQRQNEETRKAGPLLLVWNFKEVAPWQPELPLVHFRRGNFAVLPLSAVLVTEGCHGEAPWLRIPVKPPHKGGHNRFLASQKRCPDLQKEVLRGQIRLFAYGWFVEKAPHARR